MLYVVILQSPGCTDAAAFMSQTDSRQSASSMVLLKAAVSDNDNPGSNNDIQPESSRESLRERRSDGTGDPYISPLLDSMSRRLRRLQRLNDQNDMNLVGDTVDTPGIVTATKKMTAIANDRQTTANNSGRDVSLTTGSQDPSKAKEVNVRAGRIDDDEQLNSIHANAPAVLLQSGPGTGKSSVLAARIAYLLKSGQCLPENLVVLSFTNRDAAAIKQRGCHVFLEQGDDHDGGSQSTAAREKEMSALAAKIWSGTLHAFSSGILKKYGGHGESVRIVASRDMKKIVKSCISRLIGSDDVRRSSLTIDNDNQMKMFRQRFAGAMNDANQNLSTVVANVVRAIELWKESGMLQPPILYRIPMGHGHNGAGNAKEKARRVVIRRDCIELAVRWGVPQSIATLALDVYPDYQVSERVL